MTARTHNRNGNLETAIALLIENRAAFVAQHGRFLNQMADMRQREIERFAKIHEDLNAIKAVLVRHEVMLEKLPEAIREKIGFKG